MKIYLSKKNRAFAVIIVMVAIVVLTIMAAAFAFSMKVETRLAANANDEEQMIWLGRAGMERARWFLSIEANQPYNSLQQYWAGGPGDGPETNSALAFEPPLQDAYPVGLSDEGPPIGTISIKIIDLERKININTAPPQLLQQVFNSMGVDGSQISELSDSILDWIDADDATRPAGAESDYYQGLNPPYYAKNAPMDDLSELLLVKGVTPEMYFGPGSTNVPESAFQRHKSNFGGGSNRDAQYAFGFADVFTPFSSGKINANTAGLNVLELIPGMDTDSAQNIVKYRQSGYTFQNPGQLAAAGVNPQVLAQVQNFFVTRSTTFQVTVTARIGEQTREFTGIIFCNGNKTQLVSFYW